MPSAWLDAKPGLGSDSPTRLVLPSPLDAWTLLPPALSTLNKECTWMGQGSPVH